MVGVKLEGVERKREVGWFNADRVYEYGRIYRQL